MKKSLFKNIIVTIFMMMSVNGAFADSYIMIAPADITKVECQNNKILNLHVLSTLMNEKKSVIVTSVSDGQTNFSLYMKHKKCDYKATIQSGKLSIKGDSAIKILSVDLPPELETSEECK